MLYVRGLRDASVVSGAAVESENGSRPCRMRFETTRRAFSLGGAGRRVSGVVGAGREGATYDARRDARYTASRARQCLRRMKERKCHARSPTCMKKATWMFALERITNWGILLARRA